MSKHPTHEEQIADSALRGAFPSDAGLSADAVERLYANLRPVAAERASRRRFQWSIGIAAVTGMALATSGFLVYGAIGPGGVPKPLAANDTVETPEAAYDAALPEIPLQAMEAPEGASVIQVRALRAINPSNEILHFTSEGVDGRTGPNTEEMWYDPKTGAGRMVRTEGEGTRTVQTTIAYDGTTAWVTTREHGESEVTEKAEMTGRLARSFDKLSAYRKMLVSGIATVTAQGEIDGVRTYRLRAEIREWGTREIGLLMEAEVRADNYLPISYRSGFINSAGRIATLRTKTFSAFETLKADQLPDWFGPGRGQTSEDETVPAAPVY